MFDAGAIEARLILDRTQFHNELMAATAEGEAFDGKTFTAKADLDVDQVTAELTKITSEWNALKQSLQRDTPLDVDTGEVDQKLAAVGAEYEALRELLTQQINVKAEAKTPAEGTYTIDTGPALAALEVVGIQLEALKLDIANGAPLGISLSEFNAAITRAEVEFLALRTEIAQGANLNIDVDGALHSLEEVYTAYLALKHTIASNIVAGNIEPAAGGGGETPPPVVTPPAGGGGDNGGGGGAAAAAGAGAAAGNAAAGIRTFGLAITGTLGVIGVWHIALDAAVESLVAITAASIAAAAGIGLLVPSLIAIYNHITAVNAVNSAFGDQIPILGGSFRSLAESVTVASIAITGYGGVINLVRNQTGVFAQTGLEVVKLFNTWIADLDVWAAKQGNFGGILNAGVSFLTQFAKILATVGAALDNLIKSDPGTAHFLLDIIQGAANLLEWVSKLPSPILEVGLALHSWYVWGGAAAGILSRLPGPIGAIGKALGGVNHVQLGIFSALATIAFEMARAWDSATPDVAKDIQTILNSYDQLSASDAIVQGSADIGKLNAAISSLNIDTVNKQLQSWSGTWQELDDRWQLIGHDIHTIFNTGSFSAFFDAMGNIFNLVTARGDQAQIASLQLQHDMNALNAAIQQVFQGQLKLFTITGDVIEGTIKGVPATHSYTEALVLMNLAGVQASDSFDVMKQKLQNMEAGYAAMSVQGGLLAGAVNAVTFSTEQQQSSITKLTGAYSQWFTTITGGLSGFAAFGSDVATLDGQLGLSTKNLGGFTAANFTAQTQFVSTANGAQTLFNSLLTLTSAANLGQKGTEMMTQAMKDMLAILIPAAKGNVAMQTSLVAMAQEVDPNITGFQQLTKWVGNVKDPMDNLDSIMQTLTKDTGNLTTDIQNLSTALGTTLTAAEAQAALAATNGQQNFDAFAKSILTTKFNSDQDKTSALQLSETLYQLTGSTNNAKNEFIAFAEDALHLTQQQAETLWHESLPGLQNYINGMHGKNLDITMNGQGSYTIQQLFSGGQGGGGPGQTGGGAPGVGAAATGMYVHTGSGPTADDNIVRVSRGELIVPANIVASGVVDHLRGAIPGFASGGMIGSPYTGNLTPSFLGAMYQDFQTQMTNAMVAAMRASIKASESAAASAMSKGGGITPAGITNSSGYAALQAAAASVGWTGAMWQALVNVENREAGFSLTATNPSSGAYGMAQFINGPSEYYQYGGNPNTYAGQAAAMVNYILQRYGNPEAAWQHELAYGWYDNGGVLPRGVTMAVNTSGRNEYVVTDDKLEKLAARLDCLIDLSQQHLSSQRGMPPAIARGIASSLATQMPGVAMAQRYPTNR